MHAAFDQLYAASIQTPDLGTWNPCHPCLAPGPAAEADMASWQRTSTSCAPMTGGHQHLHAQEAGTALPVVVVYAQTAADVEVLQVKALRPDLPHKADHDLCCIPEDVHLQPASKHWSISA